MPKRTLLKRVRKPNRYQAILAHLFHKYYVSGSNRVEFNRTEFKSAADELGIPVPANLGDITYSLRYRADMMDSVLATQPLGQEWVIEGIGRSKYAFVLVKLNRIAPRQDLATISIPDATPKIVSSYAQGDEQALLAIVRYNRLIDIFLGITTYSLQNHLRSTLRKGSQMEIDELYVGLDLRGRHYIIPVQAKGGSDRITSVQARQDIDWCGEKFPGVACRAVAVQFMTDERIAMFELALEESEVRVVEERHYRLVRSNVGK